LCSCATKIKQLFYCYPTGNKDFFTFAIPNEKNTFWVFMIVSIRHSVLKGLFEKGTAAGISRELKDFLLLWLSVIHAAKDLRDLSIKNIGILDEGTNSYRLKVHGVGTFSFRFIDGEIRQLDYKQELN